MRINRNNIAHICGEISAPGVSFHHSHKFLNYYIMYVNTKRLSGTIDRIPVIISQDMYDTYLEDLKIGARVSVIAEIHSCSEYDETGKHHVNVYADACKMVMDDSLPDKNEVLLKCHVCQTPISRITPNGKRIADLMLAVNRIIDKADYIPAIAWGSVASLSETVSTKDNIIVHGRFQSRQFIKKVNNTEITGVSYELSINDFALGEVKTPVEQCTKDN